MPCQAQNVCKTNTHFVLLGSKGPTVLKMLKKDAQYNGHLTSFAKLPPQLASFLSYSLCTKTLPCQINVPRYSFLLSLKIF